MADVEDEERSVLYDLWVLSPEWTDSTENNVSCVFYYSTNKKIVSIMI